MAAGELCQMMVARLLVMEMPVICGVGDGEEPKTSIPLLLGSFAEPRIKWTRRVPELSARFLISRVTARNFVPAADKISKSDNTSIPFRVTLNRRSPRLFTDGEIS